MDTDSLKLYCQASPGAESRHYGHPSNILVYFVGGKRFAWFKTSEPEQWRFTIRATPERFLELTDVPGIKPARFMARFYWVTIVDVRAVPEDYLRELVDWSYRKAFDSLPRRRQTAIAAS